MLRGLLCIAHDGSFMAEESTKHCLAGVIIYCRSSRQGLKLSIAESSEAVSNHCGELLGAVIALLILPESSHDLTVPLPSITLFCNNHGVLSHGNNPYTVLPEKQKQADLICLIKLRGLLCIAHDGSFMAEESTKYCSAGVIIYCRSSRQGLKSSTAESLEAASNYCRELLGAVIALPILPASSHNLTVPLPSITLFCNNRGVLSHGNNPYTALPEKQKQADLIHLIKLLSASSNIT